MISKNVKKKRAIQLRSVRGMLAAGYFSTASKVSFWCATVPHLAALIVRETSRDAVR